MLRRARDLPDAGASRGDRPHDGEVGRRVADLLLLAQQVKRLLIERFALGEDAFGDQVRRALPVRPRPGTGVCRRGRRSDAASARRSRCCAPNSDASRKSSGGSNGPVVGPSVKRRARLQQTLHQSQGAAAEDQRQRRALSLPAVPVALNDRIEGGLRCLQPLELVEHNRQRLFPGKLLERLQRLVPGFEAKRHAGAEQARHFSCEQVKMRPLGLLVRLEEHAAATGQGMDQQEALANPASTAQDNELRGLFDCLAQPSQLAFAVDERRRHLLSVA